MASEQLEVPSIEFPPNNIDFIRTDSSRSVSKLRIAMLVVGVRGDIQPMLAVAKRLQEFGHQVRVATHSNFAAFVKSAGVDFYPLGGDAHVFREDMGRAKGWFPSSPREMRKKRKQLKAIVESVLPACTEADIETGKPFRAQAIIANPAAYGHVHVAEGLGIPIHIFTPIPWTPTNEFSHPFVRVPKATGCWLSYLAFDLFVWWGIREFVNNLRRNKLKLDPIPFFSLFSGSISHLPTANILSPHLLPKPRDWGPQVDVVGYCFLNTGRKYQPPVEFDRWIQQGPQPVYIGFGSMFVEDPKNTINIIIEALQNTGQRGIIDRGWGDFGLFLEVPDNAFVLEDSPHDWLFPQCLGVVIHGGPGTIATALRAGCPTTIVPFFGDHFFWGDRIHRKGLGPAPIPFLELNVGSLSDAIRVMLQPEVKSRAMEMAKLMENEDGVAGAVDAFHRHLPREVALPRPLPKPLPLEKDPPNSLQWLFFQIGKLILLFSLLVGFFQIIYSPT